MRRILSTLYGAIGYLAFLLPIGYLVGFLADAGVPKTVNRGAGPLGPSLVVDVLLLVGFGLQHSVMARPWFKRVVQRWLPEGLERSTYVLASGSLLGALFWLWRPIPMVIWDLTGTSWGALVSAGYGLGWALAVWATFALSHFHLFGVTQATAHARGDDRPRLKLRESRLYRIVRHPMTAGLLIAFWSTPRMTLGHAVFAAGMTVYSLWATVLEEGDLLRRFPEAYRRYRSRVPALVPLLRHGIVLPRRGGFAVELLLVGALALAPFASVVGTSVEPPPPGPTTPPMEPSSIPVGGRDRTFVLFDPTPRRRFEDPRPLVLALHGSGGDAARFRAFLGGALEREAAERDWIVAYPEADEGVWRECRIPRSGPSNDDRVRDDDVDDVAYIRKLIRHLARTGRVDPARVFAVGYSGGGHMAFRLALEAPSLVQGVAVFGASPPPPDASRCQPRDEAVPVLMVNGTADLVSPFRGGEVIAPTGVPLGKVMASQEGARYFEERGRGEVVVRLIAVEGGGHVVPGPESRFPLVVGRSVDTVSGIEEALVFFEDQRSMGGGSGALHARVGHGRDHDERGGR